MRRGPSTVGIVDKEQKRERQRRAALVDLGMFIVWGVAIGAVVFAVTGQVLWVVIGPSIGVLVGALWEISQKAGDSRR
jgi:hypothetical protein